MAMIFEWNHGVTLAPQEDADAPDGFTWTPARDSIGLVDAERDPGDGLDLITEFLTKAPTTPWNSLEDRETALRFLPTASWIAEPLRKELVDHVRRTPWFDQQKTPPKRRKTPKTDSLLIRVQFVGPSGCLLYDLPDSETTSQHVWLPGRWSPGNWEEVPGGVLDELRRGDGARMPWLSPGYRKKFLERLHNDHWGYTSLRAKERELLIRHVEMTPYWLEDDDPYIQCRSDRPAPG